jgi:preprotein translocase subunit SecG
MSSVVLVLHLLVAIGLVCLVLMQRSEGGALGIGGGNSSLISGRGAADVLARSTGVLALLFFVTSISLTLMAGGGRFKSSVVDEPAHKASIFDNLLPKAAPKIVAPPPPAAATPPAAAGPVAALGPAVPAAPPTGDVAPAPTQALERAGPIDATPTPLPSDKPAVAKAGPAKTAAFVPAKPATPAKAETGAAPAKPKPVVRAATSAPASKGESGEPAQSAPAQGRAGPDE